MHTFHLFIFVSPHLLTSVVYLSKILFALVRKQNIFLAFDFGLYEWHDLFIGFYLSATCANLSIYYISTGSYVYIPLPNLARQKAVFFWIFFYSKFRCICIRKRNIFPYFQKYFSFLPKIKMKKKQWIKFQFRKKLERLFESLHV